MKGGMTEITPALTKTLKMLKILGSTQQKTCPISDRIIASDNLFCSFFAPMQPTTLKNVTESVPLTMTEGSILPFYVKINHKTAGF
jgi:hypothetical protein